MNVCVTNCEGHNVVLAYGSDAKINASPVDVVIEY